MYHPFQNEDIMKVDGFFKCIFCPKIDMSVLKMKDHVKRIHLQIKEYQCDECRESFSVKKSLEIHKRKRHINTDKGSLVGFRNPKNVYGIKTYRPIRKEDILSVDGFFECAYCPKRYRLKSKLTEHLTKDHLILKEFQCDQCPESFYIDIDLQIHLLNQHDYKMKKSFKCNICSESFNTPDKERKHKNEVHGVKKRYTCDECAAVFNWEHLLKCHVETLHRAGPLRKCHACDFETHSYENMTYHLIKHKKKTFRRIHYCDVCLERFTATGVRSIHMYKVHNIDKRIKCNACDKSFFTKAKLSKHLDTFHKLGPVYKCRLCDYETYCTVTMRKHNLVHTGVRNYKCIYCQKSFKSNHNRLLHEMIHTGVRRKVCKECGQAFVQKASLNYHMSKYHPGVPF